MPLQQQEYATQVQALAAVNSAIPKIAQAGKMVEKVR